MASSDRLLGASEIRQVARICHSGKIKLPLSRSAKRRATTNLLIGHLHLVQCPRVFQLTSRGMR